MMLKNCPLCGLIYEHSSMTTVCPRCWQKNENDFKKIKEYLLQYPNKNIMEVSEATGVSVDKIRMYLREDRLIAVNNSSASLLDCQKCGKAVSSGLYCEHCQKEVDIEMKKAAGAALAYTKYKKVIMHTRQSYGRR